MLIKKYYPNITILSDEETVDAILKEKKSVARFGDGEISWIMQENIKSFQKGSVELAKRLTEVLSSNDENLLLCIPSTFVTLKGLDINSKHFWRRATFKQRFILYFHINRNVFGNSLFTRPYMIYKNKSEAIIKFKRIKEIWNERDVVIIEGEFTCFGVNNDLLTNTRSVKRIIAPAENAFVKYELILNEAKKIGSKEILFLLALGPTATILAYDLSRCGYQAIDIGHLDIEYEWFLRKTNKKIPINGKYVNEVGSSLNNPSDCLKDDKYNNSILIQIE